MKANLEIELLRTLVAFADCGSFKGAAQLVCRSQPAVSMQMRRLEELVGQPLFGRRGREVIFTDRGMQLALQARQILAIHDRILDEMHGEELDGRVRIGIPDDYAMLILPNILKRFSDHYPRVSLEIVANTTPILTEQLANGDLDLAILATRSPEERDVILRREPIVWVSSPRHSAHTRRPVNLALFSDESPIYRATIAALEGLAAAGDGSLEFRIGVKSKSWAVLTTAAACGFAVATMARCVVAPGLRILGADDGFPPLGHIHIVMRATPDTQSVATSRLAEKILGGFRDELGSGAFDGPPELLREIDALLAV